ncbi:ABC transporter permease [Mycoplasma tauri]|uniref:ABC transporter permease n=1 Tax=Mycoplasma tauri TaxID=547987 RepID=UPI00196795B5|nr:ABC transporter permease [Mycoplasma tauri]MBZ4218295.1 ABC transporter permease [Mycoplasma tauri]QSB07648.1 ABC transporter permease [Mycoplasma tauri]
MNKFFGWLKGIYIHLILLIFYIPLFFAVVFSFNQPSTKGFIRTSWNGFTLDNWKTALENGRESALLNSVIVAFFVSIFVVLISLITCYGLWNQKNKRVTKAVLGSNNIPLINPDNITAIGLALLFTLMFGTLSNSKEGLIRGIVGHTIMALPYGITLMFPRNEKFNASLLEAAQDLGYNKIRAWFKTYFIHMLPSSIFTALVAAFLSFDDFIIMRTVSNTSTLGTKLYEGEFRSWGLVIGATLLIIVLVSNIIYICYKTIKIKKYNSKIKKLQKDNNDEESMIKTNIINLGGNYVSEK